MTKDAMLPGEHPHSDRPNWRPAERLEEYLLNVREGLEKPSKERVIKFLQLNRTHAWRCEQYGYIPDGLFERLLKGRVDTKQMAQIGLAIRRGIGNQPAEIERCPHCGEVVRVRWMIGTRARKIIQQWIDDGMPDNTTGERNDDENVIYLPDSTNTPAPATSPGKRSQ